MRTDQIAAASCLSPAWCLQAVDPHYSHHWDQPADGPAAGQRSYSMPVRRQAFCEADQYMSDLPEVRCITAPTASMLHCACMSWEPACLAGTTNTTTETLVVSAQETEGADITDSDREVSLQVMLSSCWTESIQQAGPKVRMVLWASLTAWQEGPCLQDSSKSVDMLRCCCCCVCAAEMGAAQCASQHHVRRGPVSLHVTLCVSCAWLPPRWRLLP